MKKTMEQQLKEILAVTEEQQGMKGLPKELKDIKIHIKNLVTVIKITMIMAIIGVALLAIGCIGLSLDYAKNPDPEAAKEIYTGIQGLIVSAAILYITIVCKRFCDNIIKSNTPFIPQVPKGLRKMAAAIVAMLLISIAASAVYSEITNTEFTLFIDTSGWIFVYVLILVSSIFDYGCKLQKESDETL